MMRTAVVTGAGSGIGRSTAILLASRGYRVIAVGRRVASLEETLSLMGGHKGNSTLISLDVRDRAEVFRCLGAVGAVDVLIAASGVCTRTWIDQADADDIFDDVMATNVQGVWNTFRALNPILTDGARAVVISSGLGKLARPGYSAYTASKHAVLGIVKCLALELAPRNIRVNAVCPGWVDTAMARADLNVSADVNGTSAEVELDRAVAAIPMKRFVSPEEVALLVGWLVSDESSAITAQSYNISCGEFFI